MGLFYGPMTQLMALPLIKGINSLKALQPLSIKHYLKMLTDQPVKKKITLTRHTITPTPSLP